MSSFSGRPKRPKRPTIVPTTGPAFSLQGTSANPGGPSRPSSGYGDRERPLSNRVRPAAAMSGAPIVSVPPGEMHARPRAPPGSRPWDSSTATTRPPRGGRRLIEAERGGSAGQQRVKGHATRIAASIYLASSVPNQGAAPRPRSSTGSRMARPESSGGSGVALTGRSTLQRASTAPLQHPQQGGLGMTAPPGDTAIAPRFTHSGQPSARTWGPGSMGILDRITSSAAARPPTENIRPKQNNFVSSAGASQSSVGASRPTSAAQRPPPQQQGDPGRRAGRPPSAWGSSGGAEDSAASSRSRGPPAAAAAVPAGGVGQPPSVLRTTSSSKAQMEGRVRPPSSSGRTGATGVPDAALRPTTARGTRPAPAGPGTATDAAPSKTSGSGNLPGRKSLTYGPGSQSSQGSSGNQTEVVQVAGHTLRAGSGAQGPGTGMQRPWTGSRDASGSRPTSARPSSSHGGTWGSGVSTSGGLSDYSIGKVLGEGGFCEVRLGVHHQSKRKVAIKVIDKARLSDINDRKRVAREIKVLKKLHHACIVRCFDVIDTPAKIYIVMENASSGSLLDYVRSKKRLREPEAAKFLQQVVHGLIYCHSKGVIHRDIKLENLLLDSDTNIRIIDFGLSAITAPGKRLKVFCGSPSYAAPEIVARRQYDGPPVDVWSLGVVLFAMICGYLPFHAGGDRQALCRKIMKGHYSCPDTISAEAKDLLEQMLTVDPEARITLKQVLAHPWVSHATRWTPPAANRYTISLDVRGVPMAHPEILRRMEALGTSREDVLDALTQREVNRVTAMYFLLQDQWLEQQAGATSHAHATALVRAATAQGGARPLSAAGTGGGAAARAQTAPDGAREEEGRCGERVKAPDVRGVWGPGQTAPSGSAKDTVLYGHAAMSHRPHLVAPTR